MQSLIMEKSIGNGLVINSLIYPHQLYLLTYWAFILGFIWNKTNVFIYAIVYWSLRRYTTFSTMNTELVELYKSKNYRGFIFYALSSYLGGLILVFVGYYLAILF